MRLSIVVPLASASPPARTRTSARARAHAFNTRITYTPLHGHIQPLACCGPRNANPAAKPPLWLQPAILRSAPSLPRSALHFPRHLHGHATPPKSCPSPHMTLPFLARPPSGPFPRPSSPSSPSSAPSRRADPLRPHSREPTNRVGFSTATDYCLQYPVAC
jgi:hypothetical protein